MSSHSFHPTSKACGDPGLGNGYVETCFLLYIIRKNAIDRFHKYGVPSGVIHVQPIVDGLAALRVAAPDIPFVKTVWRFSGSTIIPLRGMRLLERYRLRPQL